MLALIVVATILTIIGIAVVRSLAGVVRQINQVERNYQRAPVRRRRKR